MKKEKTKNVSERMPGNLAPSKECDCWDASKAEWTPLREYVQKENTNLIQTTPQGA
jgi:hypothetical protein